jgi:AmmeMemoRadiSam system protein A
VRRVLEQGLAERAGDDPPPGHHPTLGERRGVFVTLRNRGQLRGCIGNVIGEAPLWEAAARMGLAAATRDPRFPSVTATELRDIDIEVSALTPLKRISSAADVDVGRHGVMVAFGARAAVLLPQVAAERGWDAETFLDHTAEKAGLDRAAWRDPSAELHVFEAEVFDEETTPALD